MNRRSAAILAALLITAAAPLAAQTAHPKYGAWGVATADMDKSVKPGDDFFRYAEGTWLRTAQIPADKSRAGYNYELPDQSEVEVRQLIADAGPNPTDPIMRQISDFYGAWMDEAGIERRGLAPARPYLQRIAAIRDRTHLVQLMAEPGFAGPVGNRHQPRREGSDPLYGRGRSGPAGPSDARLLSAARRQI